MFGIEASSADSAWTQAARELIASGQLVDSRDEPTRELRHVVMAIENPRDRIVFARPMNPAFAVAEVLWILAGANDARFLEYWNPKMAESVDPGSRTRYGAYGHRLGCRPKISQEAARTLRLPERAGSVPFDQLRGAFEALRATPHSRQVVLQIWDRSLDFPDSRPRSADIPCNVVSHLLLRRGCLEWLQVMRSNDLVWGLPYNFVQWTSLQEVVAGWLGVQPGQYVHVSDSLHVYRRHWRQLPKWAAHHPRKTGDSVADLRVVGYDEWEELFSLVVDLAIQLTRDQDPASIMSIRDEARQLPKGYRQWITLLSAETLRRAGCAEDAYALVGEAGSYWSSSWRYWAASRPIKS